MLTRADAARLMTSGLKTIFQKGYAGIATQFQLMTTEVKSTKASEEYWWLGENPGLKEWIDERTPKALIENGFTLKNKDYEATIAVDRNALDDDQYGQITARVNSLAISSRKSYDRFFTEVVEAGDSELSYDGQNFFDTDHQDKWSDIVQSNYTASGGEFDEAQLELIITAMAWYKDDQGNIAGLRATHVFVPANLEFAAKKLLDPAAVWAIVSTTPSALKGRLSIIVWSYLSTTGWVNAAFYVLDLAEAVKPFIYQNRKELTFEAQDDPSTPDVFMRKQLHYWVDARFAFWYGDWRLAYKSKG